MKKRLFVLLLTAPFATLSDGNAVSVPSCCTIYQQYAPIQNCRMASMKITCGDTYKIEHYNCVDCPENYFLVEKTDRVCSPVATLTYNDCVTRCPGGMYAGKKDGINTCLECPPPGTSHTGSTDITACYIFGDETPFSDETGSGRKNVGNCYYTE